VPRLLVPRILATGSLVGTATAIRTTSRCAGTLARRTPPLVPLALTEQWTFRDELLALTRDLADTSYRELRKGLEDFDARTRPHEAPARRRPYRVKP
jgi:hypothetical protein